MTDTDERSQLQLRSLIRSDGELELSLVEVPIVSPGPAEVLVRIEASPLNPSDHGLLFGAADMRAARQVAMEPTIKGQSGRGSWGRFLGRTSNCMAARRHRASKPADGLQNCRHT